MKIALCLYGQWRASEKNLNNLAEWFRRGKLKQHHPDVFASIKNFNSFDNTPVSVDEREQFTKNHTLEKPWTEKQIRAKINKYFEVHGLRIRDEEFDKETMNGVDHCGIVYNTMVDSLQLKQLYELENNIVYDLVILTRGDVNPKGGIYSYYLKNWLIDVGMSLNAEGNLIEDTSKLKKILDDFGYSVWIDKIILNKQNEDPWYQFHTCWSDLWIMGSSLALDAFAGTAMQLMSSDQSPNRIARHFDSHYSLDLIRKQSGLIFNPIQTVQDIVHNNNSMDRLAPEVVR